MRRLTGLMLVGALAMAAAPQAASAERWDNKRMRCFDPIKNSFSKRIHCFRLYKLKRDGNRKRDYWALHHYGTARARGDHRLTYFGLETFRHEDGPKIRSWIDWSPAEDIRRDPCDQLTFGVSYIASLTWTQNVCDEWDMTIWFNSPGHFRTRWLGNAGDETERHVGYMYIVSVDQRKKPRWHFRSHTRN